MGGVWNYLGYFQNITENFSGYIMIFVGVMTYLEIQTNKPKILLAFTSFVIVSSIYAEYIGTSTGMLFGEYSYSNRLNPLFFSVPLAIGFAWFTVLYTSYSLVSNHNLLFKVIATGLLMTIFDWFLEPAAINLGYWNWSDSNPPLFNYITWFGLSIVYASILSILRVKIKGKNLKHIFIAQILYFIISSL